MTLPVRDMHEAKRFFVTALGGTVAFERPAHITVIVGGAKWLVVGDGVGPKPMRSIRITLY